MNAVIKKSPIDNDLARCVARLVLANKNLTEKLRGRDFNQILLAIRLVKSSMEFYTDATRVAPESLGNATAAACGVALMCEGERLCKGASEGLRLFFEVIPGGRA